MINPYTARQSLLLHLAQESLTAAVDALDASNLPDDSPVFAGLSTQQRATFRLGVRAAPLLLGFSLFIAEQSAADRVGKLLFFTREGEFFHQVFRRVFSSRGLVQDNLAPAAILEVSRLATFSGSLQSLSIEEMMRLWRLYSSQSIFALGKSLGIDPGLLAGACERCAIALEEDILRPWQDTRIHRLFSDAEFKEILTQKIHADRRTVLAYFAQQGISTEGATLGVVDIGWRGTIQDNLALMMPGNRFCGYYLGLQRFLNAQPHNGIKRAYGPNANHDLLFSHLLDAVSPLEMLCNSPHGSVMGYDHQSDGTVRAIRLSESSECAIHADTIRHFQDGVLFGCDFWVDQAKDHGMCSADLHETACTIWNDLITKPERQISEAYAALNHNDVFGIGRFVDKKVVPSITKLLCSLISPADRRAVILYIKQTQWMPGLWHRRDLTVPHKVILAAALATGRVYKRARMWIHHHLLDRRNSR